MAASTHNQALAALTFLYVAVLRSPFDRMPGVLPAHRSRRVPTVLSRREIGRLLENLDGVAGLAVLLMYGGGLRVLECVTLRVKDIDLTPALERKYPRASLSWPWSYVFPAGRTLIDTHGVRRRHHVHATVVQRAVSRVARGVRLTKRVSCHALRHSSRRTCSRPAPTSARYKSCWATPMCGRR